MFDHMDGVMWILAKKKTQWKQDLYFTIKFVRPKLPKCYAEVTSTSVMLLISKHILDPFRKFQSFRKSDKLMDFGSEDGTLYTIHYPMAFLNYVEIEYCRKYRYLSVITP